MKRTIPLVDTSTFLQDIDAFIFDCDGVLWKGCEAISGACETLVKLRLLGKRIFFVTNNSSKSRSGFHTKFQRLGFDVSGEEIFSSSFAAALFLKSHQFDVNKNDHVYVIGEDGITDELNLMGINYHGGGADSAKKIDFTTNISMDFDKNVKAVVVGFDSEINYYKIQYAQLCLNSNPNCLFVATNLDSVAHLTTDQEWAESGAMVGAITGCTGKIPTVAGKPSSYIIDHIVTTFALDRTRLCMVGDRLDTDIVFGVSNGLKTVLTLSGVTTLEQLQEIQGKDLSCTPDYFVDSIVSLCS